MLELLGGLLLASAISGIVPVVNAEMLVIAAAAALPVAGVPMVAAVSTAGQMSTKTLLYALARWAPGHLPPKARAVLARGSEVAERRGRVAGTLVFTSAATGLPPFYGVSLASGAIGMRLGSFVTAGSLGRFLRFAVLAGVGHTLAPEALRPLVTVMTGSVATAGG